MHQPAICYVRVWPKQAGFDKTNKYYITNGSCCFTSKLRAQLSTAIHKTTSTLCEVFDIKINNFYYSLWYKFNSVDYKMRDFPEIYSRPKYGLTELYSKTRSLVVNNSLIMRYTKRLAIRYLVFSAS